MGISATLLGLPAEACDRVRADPGLAARWGMSAALRAIGAGASTAEVLDLGLAEVLPGCLWAWWPGFVRRAALRRFGPPLPDAAPTPDAGAAGEDAAEDATPDEDETRDWPRLDLHKDWHVVHWVLAEGAEGPTPGLGEAVLGGAELGEDLGYGPARLLEPAAVARVAAAFAATSPAALARSHDARRMAAAQVYGAEAVGRPLTEHRLTELAAFYAACAARGYGVLATLS